MPRSVSRWVLQAPVPELTHHHSKTCFQVLDLPVSVCSSHLWFGPVTGHQWKRLALSICFTPCLQVVVQINRQMVQSLCSGLQARPVCRQCWLISSWGLCSAAGWHWSSQVGRVVQREKGNILYGTFGQPVNALMSESSKQCHKYTTMSLSLAMTLLIEH